MPPVNNGRIAALLFRRVGDSLLATPALRAMKECCPDSHITVLAESHVTRVFENLDFIDEIRSLPRSCSVLTLVRELRLARPESVMDFLSDPRSAAACWFSGAQRRVGFAKFPRDIAYTQKVARQIVASPVYSATHKLSLARALGAVGTCTATSFVLTEADTRFAVDTMRAHGLVKKKFAAFFVTSRREYKRWPLENFAELAALVSSELGLKVAIVGGEAEHEVSLKFARLCGLNELSVLSFRDLGQFAAILANAALYIGNDGGPKHLAVAVDTPTVTIFQNDPWEYWTPPNDIRHIAVASATGIPGVETAVDALHRIAGESNHV